MFEITKDRNLFSIRLDGSQRTPYVLDINTGIFLGLRGQPIKTAPRYWKNELCVAKETAGNHPLQNIIYALCVITHYGTNGILDFQNPYWKGLLGLCDRFQNIGYAMSYNTVVHIRPDRVTDKAFKDFVKYRKNHPQAEYAEWLEEEEFDRWCNHKHLTIDDHFTREMGKYLRAFNVHDSDLKWYAYYLSRGLYDFGILTGNRASIMNWITTYLDRVKRLGQQPQKGDFLRLYNDAVRTYELHKVEFDNQAIAEFQNSKLHALQFEDDNFIVHVPMTSAEIIAEGEAQNNCVGRLYLPKVIDHIRHIVFVRQKSNPDKSFITCEISTNGSIGQYLLRHNKRVNQDSDSYRFKQKYQEFLKNHWNEA